MRTGVAWFPDVPVAVIAITHVYAQVLSDVPMISAVSDAPTPGF